MPQHYQLPPISRERRANGTFVRRHTERKTALYNAWAHMIDRCVNPRYKGYARYGGRGITFVTEWRDYLVFAAWSRANGYQEGLEIDRRDNDGPYSPENCRWVTRKVNQNNRSSNRRLTAFGETKTLSQWVTDPRCKVPLWGLYRRARRTDLTPEQILSLPARAGSSLLKRAACG